MRFRPGIPALALRSAALCIILYQFRLLAADLADTPVFIAALAGAFAVAFLFARWPQGFMPLKKGPGPLPALLSIALIPWVIRAFIALPRYFTGGAAISLDSLLLNMDRNNFVALLPFYWAAVTSYFSARSRVFLRADIVAADTLFVVLFSIASTSNMAAYRWPVLMIAVFGAVLFLQILALIFSIPPEFRLQRKEGALAGGFLFALVLIAGLLFIRPSQERAVERGGGLLEPKLFSFDFSQVLRLENEISVNDDLVLIVKKDADDTHILLRRYTLSGYEKKQGFYRLDDPDEIAHPQRLPDRPTLLREEKSLANAGPVELYRLTNQEYYLVNFDSAAFVGMNRPVEVVPFETWDASSFSSAYAVQS
ncbi:MAG: hypothetical protein LBN21_04595, partial [Treponema sp.]|nr:hypothetical protein [Treponema sp.]